MNTRYGHPEKGGQAFPLRLVDPETAPQGYPDTADAFARTLCWTKEVGEGRVLYTQLGHKMAVYTAPATARAMLDGLLYVAR